jgi:truncated hemoglobin YjbI
MMENNMSKHRNIDYRQIVRNMPTQEIDSLFETFQNSTTRTAVETEVMNILEAEIERRIARWEVAYV